MLMNLSAFCLLKEATKMVQPSLRREGFSSIPDVTWDDVGGLDSLRKEFDRYIIRCIKHPEEYKVNILSMSINCFLQLFLMSVLLFLF